MELFKMTQYSRRQISRGTIAKWLRRQIRIFDWLSVPL